VDPIPESKEGGGLDRSFRLCFKINTLRMSLIPEHLRRELTVNWELMIVAPEAEVCPDLFPEVRLFTPNKNAVWLLTELNPDTNLAFGLCDLGLGTPELGYVDLDELELLAAIEGFEIEVDLEFDTTHRLSEWAERAKIAGRVEDW
jgi:hypothetical protein